MDGRIWQKAGGGEQTSRASQNKEQRRERIKLTVCAWTGGAAGPSWGRAVSEGGARVGVMRALRHLRAHEDTGDTGTAVTTRA